MAAINAFYAQSGGVTAVINATACGLIQEARRLHLLHPEKIGKVLAGRDGIIGALTEDLIDTSRESDADIARLLQTPGGAFGSCRYKLKSLEQHRAQYERLIEVFRAHQIGYFFYNGGNDSMDTAWKVSQIAEAMGYPVVCVGIPKTIDNDLPLTDCCPGFGSVAKYVATSIREAGYDVASMARTSTRIFVLEVMGRHAGWITAACGLASEQAGEPPHLLLFPEVPFDPEAFLARVDQCVRDYGYCTVAVSEGLRDAAGNLLAESGGRDAFGHAQLGGVGQYVAQLIKDRLGHKYHWALADYLQRSARHLASRTDLEQAHALGVAAVDLALQGKNAVMATIVRESDAPYRWRIGEAPLAAVANVERKMPAEFISADGFQITDACRRYLQPLIEGEAPPPFRAGLPDYVRLQNLAVEKKLAAFAV
ncbi:MAG: 6-phosphofructokinase [Azonexus sp.]|nr:6-phosphofructokinase [Azonexus sp.]MCK6413109.1 6-phosphofructokinase [Azonexus sp.]